jgi:indolepyruvate ferredoxin oxidoreductase beta subunit
MAQRGGSVVTYVKIGNEVHSPLIEQGEADFIIAFEELEALRWSPYLKKTGMMIVNTWKIPPLSVTNGKTEYPQDVIGTLKNYFQVTSLDAYSIAKIEKNLWIEAIKEIVKPELVDVNIKAFEAGYEYKNENVDSSEVLP